jgi:hypothetical protein
MSPITTEGETEPLPSDREVTSPVQRIAPSSMAITRRAETPSPQFRSRPTTSLRAPAISFARSIAVVDFIEFFHGTMSAWQLTGLDKVISIGRVALIVIETEDQW